MTNSGANRSLLVPTGAPVTRRHFVNGAATLAGGVAAGTLLSPPTWSQVTQQARMMPANPPPSYDPRDPRDSPINYLTPVKDQDSPVTCNACTAFAVVAAVEATYNKKNSLPGSNGPDLNELDLFNNPTFPSGGCATTHWWPKDALNYCQNPGLKSEGTSTPPLIKIGTPQNLLVDADLQQTQKNMKSWIAFNGPVVAVMVQFEDFYGFGDCFSGTSNSAVYSAGKGKRPGPIIGGHSIAIVGYSGNDHWICKNSWGQDWNGDGYVRIAQGKNARGECYIDRIDVWGLTVLP